MIDAHCEFPLLLLAIPGIMSVLASTIVCKLLRSCGTGATCVGLFGSRQRSPAALALSLQGTTSFALVCDTGFSALLHHSDRGARPDDATSAGTVPSSISLTQRDALSVVNRAHRRTIFAVPQEVPQSRRNYNVRRCPRVFGARGSHVRSISDHTSLQYRQDPPQD
jgi:hypothetical protein